MAIPSQTEMFAIVLKLMADGKEYSRKTAKSKVRSVLHLSDEECNERTKSGAPVYGSRVAWSITFLERAGLINRIRRATYVITDLGQETIAEHLSSSELSARLRNLIAEKNPWQKGVRKKGINTDEPDEVHLESAEIELIQDEERSPREQIENLVDQMDSALGEELLKAILDQDSFFFERLVIKLLERMGYGHGVVTKKSGDGGIDGIVSTDELGFHPILTQAKRFDAGNVVGAPMVQAFAGALGGIRNGIFVTTSSFSRQARDYARSYPYSTILLIDGKQLVNLMIKYDVGVTTESVIKIKRLDLDFFANEE